MSKILIKYNRQTQSFEFTDDDLLSTYCDLVAVLDLRGETISFDDLRFGFTAKDGDNIISERTYPPDGVKYICSDQEVLETFRLEWQADMVIDIDVWQEQTTGRVEGSHQVTVPRPPQPYPSWTWNSETLSWDAPIPYPDDGKVYEWNEAEQRWDEVI